MSLDTFSKYANTIKQKLDRKLTQEEIKIIMQSYLNRISIESTLEKIK